MRVKRKLYVLVYSSLHQRRKDNIDLIIGNKGEYEGEYYSDLYSVTTKDILKARVYKSKPNVIKIREKISSRLKYRWGKLVINVDDFCIRELDINEYKKWVDHEINKTQILRDKMISKYDKILGNLCNYINWEEK